MPALGTMRREQSGMIAWHGPETKPTGQQQPGRAEVGEKKSRGGRAAGPPPPRAIAP